MSNTRSTGKSLLPIVDPEVLLRTAAAERRRLAKIAAISSETSIHVPSTSLPSTSFHTPITSPPGTPANPLAEPPFTPSLLRTVPMADPPNPSLSAGNDPPKDNPPKEPKKADPPKGSGSSSSKSTGKNTTTDHYVELLFKLQHTAAVQLEEERRLNIEQRQADRERIARLENTLFDVVIKSEEEKSARLTPIPKSNHLDLQKFRITDGPSFKGVLHDIEPFLKWITQLEIFFSTKGVTHDDDKIHVAGGLLENTRLLNFYISEGPTYIGKSWNEFKTRLFEVALPQRWRNTLRTKLRHLVMGPKETFITFSGRARTLQTLINFDRAASPTPATSELSDFDLAEFVTLGVTEELRGEIAKFALLDTDPFVYATFEKRVAVFDEVTTRPPAQRPACGAPSNHSPSNSPPDPVAWRVHAYLDSQGQCHHCKTTCGSAPGACTKPLNKKWVEIPDTFQTPRRPADYKPPQAHGSPTSTAGKATHPPAGRPPFRSASLAAVAESNNDGHSSIDSQIVNVVEAIEEDDQVFIEAVTDDSAPPDLTPTDWATFKEIDDILSDNVANVEEDEYVPILSSTTPPQKSSNLQPTGCFAAEALRLHNRSACDDIYSPLDSSPSSVAYYLVRYRTSALKSISGSRTLELPAPSPSTSTYLQ
ncbi:hypothetical protein Pst134EA_029413 [Puccinia striiformis f. sp. tritici]|uniref:hypothetical protein n=1 Tax=Puccinia striiformis f. sp. tritici TaxID=168172 RepID=UPI002007D489|nr:hypothetical protein Pst134EA_029413 [Puccinia striiformis f. sp. tritici]KAH9447373.1 hypothetical protein Pst134EA_029413 [Puccinia striiformis f. sp. tritici]